MKYSNMELWEQIVASQHSRIEVEVPRDGGQGWSRTGSSIDACDFGMVVDIVLAVLAFGKRIHLLCPRPLLLLVPWTGLLDSLKRWCV